MAVYQKKDPPKKNISRTAQICYVGIFLLHKLMFEILAFLSTTLHSYTFTMPLKLVGIFQTSYQSLETPTAVKKYRNEFIAYAELEVIRED